MVGGPFTTRGTRPWTALLPRLSKALRTRVSGCLDVSVSFSVSRSALIWLSEPLMVRVEVPAPDTPVPVADRSPKESATVSVNVSPVVFPVSDRLIPPIAEAWFTLANA